MDEIEIKHLVEEIFAPGTDSKAVKAFCRLIFMASNGPNNEHGYSIAKQAGLHAFLQTEECEFYFEGFVGLADLFPPTAINQTGTENFG